MTVVDFMKFKPQVTSAEVTRKLAANLMHVKSNVFDFDANAINSPESLFEFFPGLVKANDVQQIDGFSTFAGIFQYDLPTVEHCLMLYLSRSQMVLEIHTAEETKPAIEDLLKTLRSLFKRK